MCVPISQDTSLIMSEFSVGMINLSNILWTFRNLKIDYHSGENMPMLYVDGANLVFQLLLYVGSDYFISVPAPNNNKKS